MYDPFNKEKKRLTPVDWQKLAFQVYQAEHGSDQGWELIEFKARCESFMPSHARNDPLVWLQKISSEYPNVNF